MRAVSFQVISVYYMLEKKKRKKLSKFGIQGGLYGSRLSNQKWTYAHKKTIQVNDSIKWFDGGYILGLVFLKQNKKKQFMLDFRYYHGISDISSSNEKTQIRVWEIGVAAFIRHRKRK